MSSTLARVLIGRASVARAVPTRVAIRSSLPTTSPGRGLGQWGQGGGRGRGEGNRGDQGSGFRWSRLACAPAPVILLKLASLSRPALAEEGGGAAVAVAQAEVAAKGQEMLDKAAKGLQELLESLRALIADIVNKVRTLLDLVRERLPHLTAEASGWAKAVAKALGERLEQSRGLNESSAEGAKAIGAGEATGAARAGAAAVGGAPAAANALQEQAPLAVSHWDTKYRQYYPLFVLGACIGGMLGFYLMRRTRDAEYAKMSAQGVGVKGVRSAAGLKGGGGGHPPHPRRASPGGPLQENEVAAAVVREVLDVIRVNDQIVKAIGVPLKEGRMNVGRQSNSASLKGEFGLIGSVDKAQGKVSVEAVKGSGNTWRCTAISIKLPGVANPLTIPLAAPAEDTGAAAGGGGKK